jgi:hypothetical protein
VKYSKLCAKKVISDSIYWEGRVSILNAFGKGLLEILDLVLVIILTIFFVTDRLLLSVELIHNINPYLIIEWK